MSERGAGSSSGFESSTRTARPPRASFAAVYNPAADPPTTIISCFSRLERELSFGSPTLVNLSRNCSLNWPTRRPRRCLDTTKNPPGSLARGSALAIGRPLSIANPVSSANASAGKIQTNGKPPVRVYVVVADFFACFSYGARSSNATPTRVVAMTAIASKIVRVVDR